MKRKVFRFLSLILAISIVGTMLSGAAFAYHVNNKNPNTYCFIDDYEYRHKNYDTSEDAGFHNIKYTTCYKTLLIYWHTKNCTECGYQYPGDYPFGCRMAHSSSYCSTEYLGPC